VDLSVVIVNYNVRQFLENSLASIERALKGIEGEVFVVDNASDDGSAEMVREKFPAVHLIANAENLGFARSNNLALARSQGDFLLLINPDTLVQEDTFRVMIDFFRRTPEAGLAGCKILNPDGSFQLPCRRSYPTPWVAFTKIFGLSSLFPKSRLFGRYNLTYLDEDATYPVDALSGSFMMARREAFDRVGGLDESFFMYGEDLDWCFRFEKAGYKVYYVHETKIIHYKGESTRRSNIDELRHFYGAMQVFVQKHYHSSNGLSAVLNLGIFVRGAMAWLARMGRPAMMALIDILLVAVSMILAEYLYLDRWFGFPQYAYPLVFIVPASVIVVIASVSGVYSRPRSAAAKSFGAVVMGYVVISAIVFFVKAFAFSRAVALIAGGLSAVMIPGWRLIGYAMAGDRTRRSLFGRRTLIVGTGPSAQEILRRLRARMDDGYDVLGLIDSGHRRIGEKIGGAEILGSIENVGKVIDQHRIGEVIFSADGMTYESILSVIARSNDRSVNYRLVPNSLEAIVGKTSIDRLDAIPLVDIEYNLHRAGHRLVKRTWDLVLSAFLLVSAYPVLALLGKTAGAPKEWAEVFRGRMSFVGLPANDPDAPAPGDGPGPLGPVGVTGLVQINEPKGLDDEGRQRCKLFYAKNQSLLLDLQILMRSRTRIFHT
jgi:O-antigen biosynthesis protein